MIVRCTERLFKSFKVNSPVKSSNQCEHNLITYRAHSESSTLGHRRMYSPRGRVVAFITRNEAL